MTEQWLQDLRTQTSDHLERLARMQDQLASAYGEARTAAGRVLVRVNPAGRPTAITLSPAATSMPPDDLAAAVLAAVDEATVRASAQVRAIVGQVIAADDLDALMRGRVSDIDRESVREQLDALRAQVE